MEKADNILYSIIPLILIIVLSWLFSFLGSKKRKETEGAENSSGMRVADQFFDFVAKGEERQEVPREGPPEWAEVRDRSPDTPWIRQPAMRGPQISAKPIEPKWWGA
jgi:hypothetical protein